MTRLRPAAAALAAFAVAACGSGSSDASPTTTTTTTTTTLIEVTAPEDLDVKSYSPPELDLPGVDATIDLTVCRLDVSVETGSLGFARDSADLPTAGPARDTLLAVLDGFATAEEVSVTGHASTEGDPGRNDELSWQRAEAVASIGRDHLPDVTFVATGMGSTSTSVPEDGTEATRSRNRRVELSGVVSPEVCQEL